MMSLRKMCQPILTTSMDKKQTITTERKIGKITYLVQALPSEKATDTIHKKIEKLIVKDLQKKPGNPGFLASE